MGFKKTKKYYIVVEETDWNTKTTTTTKTEIDEHDAEEILHPVPDYRWDRRHHSWDDPFDDHNKWGW